MVELPEAFCIAQQLTPLVTGRKIEAVVAGHSPHAWAWYSGDPADYPRRLVGRTALGSESLGGFVSVPLSDSARLIFGEGTRLRWLAPGDKEPAKHQLLVRFEGGGRLVGSVQMYGFLLAEDGAEPTNPYAEAAKAAPSPLGDGFDRARFDRLAASADGKLSLKAFLATEQRIPGFGNGVLQDVLYEAMLSPRRRLDSLDGEKFDRLFASVRETLRRMRDLGGRDTETDLFGRPGGYPTAASRTTVGQPCRRCGNPIVKESYLGGSVYTCPACQAVP